MSELSTYHTKSWKSAKPQLSILIPFFRDNPCALLKSLEGLGTVSGIEVLAYDDGTGDNELTAEISRSIKDCALPICIISNPVNQGRSAARNALQDAARADWVLFLDADMRPVKPSFLQDYLALIQQDIADVIFGGFEVEKITADKDRDLHRAFSETSDCLTLQERQAKGPQFVATSNLCVRKSVMIDEPFDSGFEGWGWEDSEWAARIAKTHRLIHVDNPALHLGLETTDTLLRRFKTSGHNYVRFTQKHPELAQSLTLYRVAKKLSVMPGHNLTRPILRALVKGTFLPVSLRLSALKLWRASWYADALRKGTKAPEKATA